MEATEVGERIATLRREKGLTQKQLAERIHVTDKAVSKWERGLNFPELTTVIPLAETLGVSAAALLGLEESSTEEALTASARLYEEERLQWLRQLRQRSWISLVCNLLIFAGLVWLSREMDKRAMYGYPLGVVGCMNGSLGVMIGHSVWTLRTVYRQLRPAPGKRPSAPDREA